MGVVREEESLDDQKKKTKKRKKIESSALGGEEVTMQLADEAHKKKRKTKALDNPNASKAVFDVDSNLDMDNISKKKKEKDKNDIGVKDRESDKEREKKKKKKKKKSKGGDEVGFSPVLEASDKKVHNRGFGDQQARIKEKTHVKEIKKVDEKTMEEKEKNNVIGSDVGLVSDAELAKEGDEQSREEQVKKLRKKKKKMTKHEPKKAECAVQDDTVDAGVIVNQNSNEVTEKVEPVKKKKKTVTFSDHVEVFSVPEKLEDAQKGKKKVDDGLIRGKRFSKEEDDIIKEAVLKYIEDHQLGEEGVEMVLKCKSHPEIKDCWKEIGESLPWRPYQSVYYRAHILFERSETRKWTEEELELVKKFHEKHGADWRTLADELGKHRFHVKDAWRRIKLANRKKGNWSQEEYENLFKLVNMDLSMKAFEEKKSKHGMLRDNISWEAISEKLETRNNAYCCMKWYNQLTSPMVAEGKWADVDDYRLIIALVDVDATCEEDVKWDELLEHRSGDLCRKRWHQMVRYIGEHGTKSFSEQVDILSERYCPDLLEARETYDSKSAVDE